MMPFHLLVTYPHGYDLQMTTVNISTTTAATLSALVWLSSNSLSDHHHTHTHVLQGMWEKAEMTLALLHLQSRSL